MLQFTPILLKDATRLYKYYKHCTFRLCEYSAGVKLMWRHLYHYEYAEAWLPHRLPQGRKWRLYL